MYHSSSVTCWIVYVVTEFYAIFESDCIVNIDASSKNIADIRAHLQKTQMKHMHVIYIFSWRWPHIKFPFHYQLQSCPFNSFIIESFSDLLRKPTREVA